MRLKPILPDASYGTFVAKIGKELCGMVGTLTHMSHEHNDVSGKIVALVVSKKQRRSGIGHALITAVGKGFRAEKCYANHFNDAFRTRRSASIL
jgi:ribosomal protein S18 acetylase RimI-like enzyme